MGDLPGGSFLKNTFFKNPSRRGAGIFLPIFGPGVPWGPLGSLGRPLDPPWAPPAKWDINIWVLRRKSGISMDFIGISFLFKGLHEIPKDFQGATWDPWEFLKSFEYLGKYRGYCRSPISPGDLE